jgi:hypothetical protein
MATVDELLPMIRQTVKDAIREEITDKLDKLELKVNELTSLKKTVTANSQIIQTLQDSVAFSSNEIDEVRSKTIPDLRNKFDDLSIKMCMNILDMDTHRRKWTLIINELQGISGETEVETRTKVQNFAINSLKVPRADSHPFGACHRLAQKDNAGIIIRFTDLAHRNSWLMNARNLKNSASKVSLSPDLHPCLRPLKSDILKIRKNLPPGRKQLTTVKYLPSWPYVCLKERGKPAIHHRISKETIVNSYLDGRNATNVNPNP